MPVASCPQDSTGNSVCEHQSTTTCSSLLPGHHQPCKVVEDGYITCVDVIGSQGGISSCKDGYYGINKNSIWVQDGCAAEFHVCYTKELPGSTVFQKTMQCESHNNEYHECDVRGPYLIQKVARKYPETINRACQEGITYGSYLNAIWVKGGCSDIFDIDYIQASPTVAPSLTSSKKTVKTTTTRKPPTTTSSPFFTVNKTTAPPSVGSSSRNISPGLIDRASTTTTMTSTIVAPERTLNDGLVLITFGALLGVFLSLLIMTFIFCWLCRRSVFMRKFLNMKKVPSSSEPEDEKVSNFYEEITCQDGPLNYTAQSENDPFLDGTASFSRKSRSGPNLEENNNPSAVQNYFVLENQPPIPRIYPAHARTPSGHSYFILEPQAAQPSAPPLPYGTTDISTSSLRRHNYVTRDRQPSPDIIKSLNGPYHVQNIIPDRHTPVDSDGYDIVGSFKQKYFLPQSKKVDSVSLNTVGSQTTQLTELDEDNHTTC